MKLSPHRLRSFRRDWRAFSELGGPVMRTSDLLERVFPQVVWGMPNPDAASPIHLTFDDGPAGDNTLRMLDVLAKHQVPATFFLGGERLNGQQDVAANIRSAGHRIGYHGLTHDSWWLRDRSCRELEMNPLSIPFIDRNPFTTSPDPLLLRAPYGRIDWAVLGSLKKLDARLVHWRLAVRDWYPGASAAAMAHVLYRFTHPGDIVVLHDGGPNARAVAAALDLVIPAWKQAGMKLSTVDPFLASSAS